MVKSTLLILAIIFLVLIQISFFYQFAFFRSYFNIVLLLAVLVTATVSYKNGVIFALTAGVTMDLYSPFTFGINTIALLIPVLLIYSTFRRLLARKSLYSLLLVMLMSTLAYHFVVWSITSIFFWLGWRTIGSSFSIVEVKTIGLQTLAHIIGIGFIFTITRFISSRITSKFLFSERV